MGCCAAQALRSHSQRAHRCETRSCCLASRQLRHQPNILSFLCLIFLPPTAARSCLRRSSYPAFKSTEACLVLRHERCSQQRLRPSLEPPRPGPTLPRRAAGHPGHDPPLVRRGHAGWCTRPDAMRMRPEAVEGDKHQTLPQERPGSKCDQNPTDPQICAGPAAFTPPAQTHRVPHIPGPRPRPGAGERQRPTVVAPPPPGRRVAPGNSGRGPPGPP
mmetsp:Transcript_17609/g.45039  ORF Transcript_17609/g.45039 Transcript_17609/m.45039 type:complete len:217 (-) Transcript_17609:59-709(-)